MVKATHAVDRVPIERGAPSPSPAGRGADGRSRPRPIPLMIANLASSGAAVLMNIATAAYVKQTTGSAAYAAAAVVVAFLPPLFASARIGASIDRMLNRRRVLIAEGMTCMSSTFCGVAVAVSAPLGIVLAGIAFRSILVASVRNSLVKWLKLETPPERQARGMQLFTLTMVLALPLSGLAMWAAPRVSGRQMVGVLVIDLGLHFGAMAVMALLPAFPRTIDGVRPQRSDVRSAGMISTFRQIANDPELAPYFYACLFTPVFQAAEQVLVSVKGQNLGANGIAQMQTFGGVGLLSGFATLWFLQARASGRAQVLIFPFVAFGLGCLVASANAGDLGSALPTFLGMTFTYEVLDTYCFSRFFERSPRAEVARYSLSLRTLCGTIMGLSALFLGLSFDTLGFARGSCAYAVGAAAYGLLLIALYRRSLRGGLYPRN